MWARRAKVDYSSPLPLSILSKPRPPAKTRLAKKSAKLLEISIGSLLAMDLDPCSLKVSLSMSECVYEGPQRVERVPYRHSAERSDPAPGYESCLWSFAAFPPCISLTFLSITLYIKHKNEKKKIIIIRMCLWAQFNECIFCIWVPLIYKLNQNIKNPVTLRHTIKCCISRQWKKYIL